MKKLAFILFVLIFPVACGTLKIVTVDRIQMGMTRADVENIVGRPEKKLVASLTEHGYQEIIAYKIGNDLYSLEFMNDKLIRYEFIREDVVFVPRPPLPPPVVIYPDDPLPVRPRPVDPPATKPSPRPPSAPTDVLDTPKRQPIQQEKPNRTPNSEKTDQRRSREGNRQTTSETNQSE